MSAVPERPAVKGVNVIGHLGSSAGLGQTARLFIDILSSKGYEVAGLEIDPYNATEVSSNPKFRAMKNVDELPYDHNIIIISIDRIPKLWIRFLPQLLQPRFRNSCILFWELPVLPPAWIPSLKLFDAIVVCSHYVRQTLEAAIPDVPTVYAEHPLSPESHELERAAIRERYRIPEDKIIFMCSFDPRSGFSRKNPNGAILSWLKAFPDNPNVRLIIKSNGAFSQDQLSPELRETVGAARNDPRIMFIADRLSNREVLGLFACCDVFISLHRSEGLGLVPMEAMSMGKLVVATGYSGNMTFMNEQNSMLVDYRLIEPQKDDYYFINRKFAGKSAVWADPDLDHASELLRLCVDEPELRRRLGQQAGADIARRQLTAWSGSFLEPLFRHLNRSKRHLKRPGLKWRILLHEVVNPLLRRRNVEALMRRFGR